MNKILFVCMANICRSPMAEGVMRARARHKGLQHRFEIASAGTHVRRDGQKPDPRAQTVAERRGYYDFDRLRSRVVNPADFAYFDYILAMDSGNLAKLQALCPPEHSHKLHLLLDFATDTEVREIPDPYYGNLQGFEHVLDLCEMGVQGVIDTCLRIASLEHLTLQTP